jgi:hypothetical protein
MSHRRFAMGGLGELAALLTILVLLTGWLFQMGHATRIFLIMTSPATTESAEVQTSGSGAMRVSLTSYEAPWEVR